ncbi:unnamed protein product [Amaranthus hypochondriacus]
MGNKERKNEKEMRANGETDVTIKILYCGVDHTDLHYAKDEFGITKYPFLPGHDIVGEITHIGSKVTKFKVGDKAGVGGIIGSCRKCEYCIQDLENYCSSSIMTFNDNGGYSNKIVVDDHFAVLIPNHMQLDRTAPLLCGGAAVYSSIMYYGLNRPNIHLGIVGLGGVGHLAVKFAKALGLKVTVISTSLKKRDEALGLLGADSFLVSHDLQQLKAAKSSMDGIIDTVSGDHSIITLIDLLKKNGKLVMLGALKKNPEIPIHSMVLERKLVGGSVHGGMKEIQEMIDFAAKHKIGAEIEIIPIHYINTAMHRLAMGDVKYRFVIDIGNTLIS